MHIPASGMESYGRRRGESVLSPPSFSPAATKGASRAGGGGGKGVENCNREGILRGTFPSLPTVCSFRVATPYLQVQCLLSLIHIPWPTHPYYPWLSAGPGAHPSPGCTCLHRASQKATVVYPSSPFVLFARACVCVCVWVCAIYIYIYAAHKVVSFRDCASIEFIREALVTDLRTTKGSRARAHNAKFRIILHALDNTRSYIAWNPRLIDGLVGGNRSVFRVYLLLRCKLENG